MARKWKVVAKYSSFYGYVFEEDLQTPPDYRGICLVYDEHKMWFSPKDLQPVD